MNIKAAQKNWDELGRQDPMWAVLSDPDKRGGKWNPEEFFVTGASQIQGVFNEFEAIKAPVNPGCALDFACGVGRLTQALAARFKEVHGVDIAPSMIELAQRFNRFPDRCHYHVNGRNDLLLFDSQRFDFICSFIALQHIPPHDQRRYMVEFVRLLKPGGLMIFQILEPTFLRSLIPSFVITLYRKLRHANRAFLPAYGLREATVAALLQNDGCVVLRVRRDATESKRWIALTFIISKPT